MATLVHWLENHLLACPYKSWTGIDCPGCGMQRSFLELLKGNFLTSVHLYPALLPLIITIVITGLHLILKFKKGAEVVKYSFISTAVIVAVSYILNIPNKF